MLTGKSSARPCPARRERGFSLVELGVVLAVAVVLATLAAPSLADLQAGSRVRATASQFMAEVNLARSLAIMQRRRTVLCPSADGSSCLPDGHWHRGWILFEDVDADREHDPGERLHRVTGAQPGVSLVTSVMRRRLTFQPTGLSPGANGTYTVCAERGGVPPRAVIVANHGRARMSQVSPDGSPLLCRQP
ncbi:MAG TPA: GspH/FimT family pseudopilin [Gammaproteobacteria bacterium]